MSSKSTHKCPSCGVTKPLDDFSINRARSNGHNSNCKTCTRDYARAMRSTPDGLARSRAANRKAAAKRRAALRQASPQ